MERSVATAMLVLLFGCHNEKQNTLKLKIDNHSNRACETVVVVPDYGLGHFGGSYQHHVSIGSGEADELVFNLDLPESDGSLILYAILSDADTLTGNLGYFTNGALLNEAYEIVVNEDTLEVSN